MVMNKHFPAGKGKGQEKAIANAKNGPMTSKAGINHFLVNWSNWHEPSGIVRRKLGGSGEQGGEKIGKGEGRNGPKGKPWTLTYITRNGGIPAANVGKITRPHSLIASPRRVGGEK